MTSTWYNVPPPAPVEPARSALCVLSIETLSTSIIRSADRLFLVANDADPNFLEWRLVRVALEDSMSLHPSCLQDGRFLVEFALPTRTKSNSIGSTSVFGYNITAKGTLLPQHFNPKRILSSHLPHQRTTQIAVENIHFMFF